MRRAAEDHPAVSTTGLDHGELLQALRAAYELLPPEESLTSTAYLAVSEAHGQLPTHRVLTASAKRLGTSWPELVAKVMREEVERLRAAP